MEGKHRKPSGSSRRKITAPVKKRKVAPEVEESYNRALDDFLAKVRSSFLRGTAIQNVNRRLRRMNSVQVEKEVQAAQKRMADFYARVEEYSATSLSQGVKLKQPSGKRNKKLKKEPPRNSPSEESASESITAAKPASQTPSKTTVSKESLKIAATESKTAEVKTEVKSKAKETGESSEYSHPNVNVEAINISAAISTLPLGADYERLVSQTSKMRYGRDEIEQDLSASFNDPDRAVEYLLTKEQRKQ